MTDFKPVDPVDYNQSEVPVEIRKRADWVRNKSRGIDVREAQAQNAEVAGLIANEARDTAGVAKITALETQGRFERQIEGTTNSDEVIDARGDFNILGTRLKANDDNIESKYINVLFPPTGFNAAKGDGITDDTVAIQSILDSLNDGDTIYFPKNAFRTTDTLTVKKSIKIEMQGTILCDHANVGIRFKNSDPEGNFSSRNSLGNHMLYAELSIARVRNKGYEFLTTAIGVEIWNAYYGNFEIKKLVNNNIGLKLIGEKYGTSYAGTSYSKFYLAYVSSYKINIYMYASGTDGYVTQNQFYSGSMTGGESADTIHVLMENDGLVMNENTFYGTSFEGNFYTAFKAIRANSNRFNDCRFEMPKIMYLFHYTSSRFNQIINGYGTDSHMRAMKYDNNSSSPSTQNKDNLVSFIDYNLGHVEYFDDIFYIKPLQNYDGRFGSYNNGVNPSKIPSGWRVEVIKDGLSDSFTYVDSSNAAANNLNLRIDYTDKIIISEDRSQFPISRITLNTPPEHSKEIYLNFRYSLVVPLTLATGGNIASIVDKTGNNNVIPLGINIVKILYEYFSNTIYVLEMW